MAQAVGNKKLGRCSHIAFDIIDDTRHLVVAVGVKALFYAVCLEAVAICQLITVFDSPGQNVFVYIQVCAMYNGIVARVHNVEPILAGDRRVQGIDTGTGSEVE